MVVLSAFYFVQIPLMMYCPPSPKWQFSRGKIVEGFETLEIFEKKTNSKISTDLKERFREQIVDVEDEPDSSIIELGKDPLIMRLSILCSTVFFLVGVAYHGTSLGAASLPGNLFANNLINSVLDTFSAVVAFLLMPKMTRRLLIGSSFAAAFSSCLISAVLFEFFPKDSTQETIGTWISFSGKFAISVAFSSSYVFISEIFPTSIRGAGMGLVSILEGLAGFFAPYLAFSENYAIVYSLYAAFSLAGCAAVWALPETLNRRLPQTISEARVLYKKENLRISTASCSEKQLLS